MADDLEIDSIKAIEITVAIEKKFKISVRDEDVPKITTVNQAVELVNNLLFSVASFRKIRAITMYDVIIIGAGISGLVCGCYLAKAGLKVLIIEQHDKPGGYFTSFKRRGFLFDAAAHSFGNYRESGHVRKILTDLGIDKETEIKRYDPSDIVITPDFSITFRNNIQDTIEGLSAVFPAERDNVIHFFNFLTSSGQSEFAKLKDKTFSDLLHTFFIDERLINSIAFPVFGNGGLPPSLMHAFSGSKIFSEFVIDGGYYTEGGIQQLPNAFVRIVRQHNGEVIYRTRVKKILHANNTVNGVTLIPAKKYSQNMLFPPTTQTFKTFLGRKTIGNQLSDTLKTMTPSVSTFILYIGIDKPFDGLPLPGTNTWYSPSMI